MEHANANKAPGQYMNSYLAGFLLGLILLAAIFVSGRGLGASGAFKSLIVSGVETISPAHAANAQYYKEFAEGHSGGLFHSWLFWEVLGVFVGGFVSGMISNRLGFKIDNGPGIKSTTRLAAAVIGGILFGMGAQFARGCTSGAALSGMAVLSTAGFLTMIMIFGSAYFFAYFFRKLWI